MECRIGNDAFSRNVHVRKDWRRMGEEKEIFSGMIHMHVDAVESHRSNTPHVLGKLLEEGIALRAFVRQV